MSQMGYTMDARFFRNLTSDALRSGAWRDMYAVDGADLHTSRPVFEKHILHLRNATRGEEFSSISGRSIDPKNDVASWTYRTKGYVEYMGAL